MSELASGYPDDNLFIIDDSEPKGFMAKNRQEIFSHHTYDLIKKKEEELALMTGARDAALELLQIEKKKVATLADAAFWGDKAHADEVEELKEKIFDLELNKHSDKSFTYEDELTHEIKRAPYYKGNGNLSVSQLEKLCKEYEEFCYQTNLTFQELNDHIRNYKLKLKSTHKVIKGLDEDNKLKDSWVKHHQKSVEIASSEKHVALEALKKARHLFECERDSQGMKIIDDALKVIK